MNILQEIDKLKQAYLADKVTKVLDNGEIRLVDWMGSDLSVSRSARVSYNAAWRAGEDSGSDKKLINYLWSNRHTTPFESVTFTFEVKAPMFVVRQWHRHRTQSYNEVSARYTPLPENYYVPAAVLIGSQAKHNKQMREISEEIDNQELLQRKSETKELRRVIGMCFETYRNLIAAGWPRELARSVLPVATYTHMFVTLNLLNLLKFIELRNDPHAQYEIRVYAEAMLELVRPIVPVVIEAFESAIKNRTDVKDIVKRLNELVGQEDKTNEFWFLTKELAKLLGVK